MGCVWTDPFQPNNGLFDSIRCRRIRNAAAAGKKMPSMMIIIDRDYGRRMIRHSSSVIPDQERRSDERCNNTDYEAL
jgi:hypothetical protein